MLHSTTRLRARTGALADLLHAFVAGAFMAVAGYVSTARLDGQGLGAATVGSEPFLEWALRQGGALAVLVIVLFFYRRDWKTAVDFWKDQNTTRDLLVKEATKAQADTAAALRENAVVIHSLKRVIEHQYPGRRFEDLGPGGGG